MSVPMTPSAITQRLRKVADLANLRSELRLYPKLDLSPRGITGRLRQAAALQIACSRLSRLRAID